MYQLKVTVNFSGAHCLHGYKGPCEQLHGHNFRVEAWVSGRELDDVGMLVDFKKVKAVLQHVVERYDHRVLNEVPPFDTMNPTAENLSRLIYEQLSDEMQPLGLSVDKVGIWETDRYCAIYTPDA